MLRHLSLVKPMGGRPLLHRARDVPKTRAAMPTLKLRRVHKERWLQ